MASETDEKVNRRSKVLCVVLFRLLLVVLVVVGERCGIIGATSGSGEV